MRLKYFILLLLIIIGRYASAQLPDIVAVEYFFDSDPGYGNGTPVAVTPNSLINVTFEADFGILPDGYHNLMVRVQDENRNWSIVYADDVFKFTVPEATTLEPLPNVIAMEYFFDADPGFGNGVDVPISSGEITEVTFNADFGSLPDGYHNLMVRVKDENGNWSIVYADDVIKFTIPEATTLNPLPSIIALEYFFDSDPGFGNGVAIPITSGENTEVTFDADFGSLPDGYHNLMVRVKDENGNWSTVYADDVFKFTIPEATTLNPLPQIVSMEYFFDADPGFGKGVDVPITSGEITEVTFDADFGSLPDGYHNLMVRVKDENGIWSDVYANAVFKFTIPEANTLNPLPQIVSMEYFFDDDPGFGLGISLNIPAGTNLDYTFIPEYSTLNSIGEHLLSVRVSDEMGRWSILYADTITLTILAAFEISDVMPKIGDVVQFTDLSAPAETINSWQWDFGDGTTSTEQNPSHSYQDVGTYDISLTVSDGVLSHTTNKENYITVITGLPELELSVNSLEFGTLETDPDLDTTLYLTVKNTGTGTLMLDSLFGLEEPFTLGEAMKGYEVAPGDSLALPITLNRNFAAGEYWDTLMISNNSLGEPVNLDEGLVAYYPFNGNANDESGNGNNGTVNGASLTTDRFGNENSAYDFDGVDDYIEVNSLDNDPFPNGTITIWFYLASNSSSTDKTLFYKDETSVDPDSYEILIQGNTGKIQIDYGDLGTRLFSDIITEQNIWYNMTATWGELGMTMYVNGEKQNDIVSLNTPIGAYETFIGSHLTSLIFNGKIDDIRIYNRALSEAEIQALYYEGTGNGGGMAQVPIHATLVEPTPQLTIYPPSINFGTLTVGEVANADLTLTNTGGADLVIDSISYTEPFFAMYSGILLPGTSQTVQVSFAPQAAIFYNDVLIIHTNAGDVEVPLTGTGEPPETSWLFSLSNHNFGWVDIEAGAVQTLTITNNGSQVLQVSAAMFGDEVFEISPAEFTLTNGQMQNVSISFNPTDIAWYGATIQFTSDAGTQDIILEGKGYFASSPPQLTFVELDPYNGTSGVSPEIGPPGTFFEYRVVYSDADNNPPMSTHPKLGIDFNGDGDFLDPGESLASISAVDPLDMDYTDGKEYSLITTLPVNMNLGYQFFANDSLGNPAQGNAAAYLTGPVVSDDELDLAIYANDISFSNANPEVGDEVVINATIRNTSDYPATDVPVSVYIMNELVYETVLSGISPQSTAGISFNHIFTTPDYYPVKVVIDEMNLLGEGNRLNNSAIRPVLVGDFSIPGAIAVTSFLNGSTAYPYGTLRFYGHASYENTKFRNSNVSGAQVVMTIHETGTTFTAYTNANGDYSIYFAVPGNLGSYTVSAEVTDFTLTTTTSSHGFSVIPVVDPDDPPPYEPTYQPDLVIHNWNVSWSGDPVVNNQQTISATFFNQGNLEAEDVVVFGYVDGVQVYQDGFITIEAGASESISFNAEFSTTGNHTVSIILDPLQLIDESVESNNSAAKSRYIYPALPDLTPIELTFSDNSPLGGQVFSISTKVKNLNWATSGATNVSFYEGADNLLGTLPLPEIGGGQTKTVTLSGQSIEASGWHAIKVVVDEGNVVDETNEGNQQLSKNIYIEQPMAELSLSGITASNYSPLPGDPMNFMASVTNNGSADAEGFYVKFSMDDVLLGDSILISGLAIGESQTVTSSIWNMEEGPHQICAVADENNQVPELNEYNNQSCKLLGIDLEPSKYPHYQGNNTTNRLTILKGETVELLARIYNNGPFRGNQAEVSFVMDGEIQETDVIPFINGGSFADAGVLHQFEDLGDFTIQIITDYAGLMEEINETNNITNLYIRVYEDQPDMMILSQHIAPSSINPEQYETISINATCFNIGNVSSGTFGVNLYVDNAPLGEVLTIDNIEPGEEASVGWADIYSTGEIGNHIIKVVLDENNQVSEIDTNNNTATRAIIVGDAPNFEMLNLMLSNEEPELFEVMQITATIQNTDGADASADLQLFYISLEDTVYINTVQFSLLKNQSTDITLDWNAQVQVGYMLAVVNGSNPPESDFSDNSLSQYFGGDIKLVNPISDVEVDEDTPTFEVANLMQVFENVDETAMSFEVLCNEANVILEINAENKLEMSLAENWNGETSAIVKARNIYDGMVSDTFLITVNPVNDPPIANAGPDQRVPEERLVQLSGSASYDIDSPELSWLWTAPAGIVLDDATLENPSFIAPAIDVETIFEIVLVVNDGELNSEHDTVQISVFPVEDQLIGLNNGFQFISSHLIILNPDFKVAMTGVLDNLNFARNSSGAQMIKIGNVWVNQIGNWTTKEGYVVKMNAEDELTLTGEVMPGQTPIEISAGFGMIGYLPMEAMNAQFALSGILDNLDYARSSSGAQLIKIGPMWVNQIGNLNPGDGLMLRMAGADTLIYPDVPEATVQTPKLQSTHFRLQNGNPAQAVWTVCFDPSMFAPGDEIGVFDGDVLVGTGVIQSENPYLNFVPVFSNLYATGQIPVIKVWNQAGKYEYVLSDYSFENPYGDAWTSAVFPEEDGRYSLVSNVTTGLEGELSGSSVVRIFPNPATNEVYIITPCQQEATVEILNQLGKTCIEAQVSQNQTRVDISGLASGIYLIKITCQNTKVVKKLVVE